MQAPSSTGEAIGTPPAAVASDRRTRNRDRTRRTLAEAAMELFAVQGYASTTVEEIADRADVSPRTFFRYFDSKEDVLLPLDHDDGSIETIRNQPAGLSDMDALQRALVATAPNNEPRVRQIRSLRSALSSSAALRGRDFDQRKRAEDQMAWALASRRSLIEPDPQARLAAAVGFAILRMAMDRWLDLPDPTPLAPLVEEEFARAKRMMADPSTGRSDQPGAPTW